MNKKQILEQDAAKTYNQFKVFEGNKYTGMRVGGRHKWYYEKGEWKETKVAPDRWEFSYAVPKRRAGHAPAGSGVPVGTEYHWYILAHQNVRKLDANTYTTALTGLKYKLAHKRAGKDTWSASDQAQRRHLIKILQEMIDDLTADMPVEKAPGSALAAAKAERAPKTRLTQRKRSAARANARKGASGRRRLVASGGRSRR
ncbi:MAG TPA: hypothetical protein VN826_03650 [Candidatus Eisenbacteria bacterium]|nr:hypothetical protein [Candidatus Eisenbacteria bacterium]